MKKKIAVFGIISLGAAALALSVSKTALAVDATGDSSATVVAPITLAQATAMNFGSIAPTTSAGTVVLSTAGARANSNVDLLTGGTIAAATFNVTGGNSAAYSITLPASAVTLTAGANTMTVDTFNHDAGGTPAVGAGGTDSFNIGSTLNVGASQAAGSYSGTYQVTVSYN